MSESLPQRIERVMVGAQLIPANFPLPLRETTNFADDLGMDSIDALDLVFALQEEFHITITDKERKGIETLEELIKFLERKLV